MTSDIWLLAVQGFIGSNYVARRWAVGAGGRFDNLSRPGADRIWPGCGKPTAKLLPVYPGRYPRREAIRNAARRQTQCASGGAGGCYHLGDRPRGDFEINALGTFNVLEAARASGRQPAVLYASTNKVYGGMEEVKVLEEESCYSYADYPEGVRGMPLDFHSPYGGCSKAAATGTCAITSASRPAHGGLRQSCIYGPAVRR